MEVIDTRSPWMNRCCFGLSGLVGLNWLFRCLLYGRARRASYAIVKQVRRTTPLDQLPTGEQSSAAYRSPVFAESRVPIARLAVDDTTAPVKS